MASVQEPEEKHRHISAVNLEDPENDAEQDSEAHILLGSLSSGASGSFRSTASPAAKVTLAAVAVVLLASTAIFAIANRGQMSQGNLGHTVQLQGFSCKDVAGWTNNNTECSKSRVFHKAFGCQAKGFTCAAYQANGWCNSGSPMRSWAMGKKNNYPELNCCVCGGGEQVMGSAVSETLAAAEAAVPEVKAPVTTCAAFQACADAGLAGECCPNIDGVQLDCCNSPPTCEDTPGWTNGFIKCGKLGFTEEQGCTPTGVTCHGYVNNSFCSGGAVVPGKEWTLGAKFNNPESNCCVCGKGSSSSA